MKRFILILLFILIPAVVYSAPDTLMSITPSASDGAVITASDENTRNTNISTPYNAHSHTDITPTSIADDDGDTQVQTEESSDEDIIRMDTQGTERWNMTAAGERTMVTQPTFLAVPTSTQSNIAAGSAVTVVFGTEVTDQGNDFSSNTFTAPVTGNYLLNFSLRLNEVDTAADSYSLSIVTSNRSYAQFFDPGGFSTDPALWYAGMSVVADMDANDTVTVTIEQTAGSNQTDITQNSHFSGGLLF